MKKPFRNPFATVKLSPMPELGQESVKNEKKKNFRKQKLFGIIVLLILLAVSVWSIMTRVDIQEVPRLVLNQTAGATIYSAIPFSYTDEEETRKLRDSAQPKLPLFFRIENTKINELKANLGKFEEEKKDILGGKICSVFSKRVAEAAQKGLISETDRDLYRGKIYRLIDHQGRRLVKPKKIIDANTPENEARNIAENVAYDFFKKDRSLQKKQEEVLYSEALKLLQNAAAFYDKTITEREVEKELNKLGMVQFEYKRGDILLRKGSTVTQQDINRLNCYEKELQRTKSAQKLRTDWIKFAQSVCIALLLILFTAIYMIHIHPEVLESGNKIWALGLIVLIALLLNILFVKLCSYIGEIFSIPPRLWYLALPLGFAPLVIGILIGVRTALFAGLFISLVASFSGMNQFNMVVFGMVISALSAYTIKGCRNYRSLFLRGFFVLTIVSTVLIIVFCWQDESLLDVMPWPFILPAAVSIATIVLVQFTLVVIEAIFDLTSKITMNLYSDYNHPLLKSMQINAPGTYHHSLVVSMLTEAAAEAIGADHIQARVGALFHDVGKIKKSEYFTENSSGENLHDKLTPRESALVITNHIREGMRLAKEYKLIRPIREAIQQHHGTDLVYYFYKQAKDSGECFDEKDFHYDGPRPRSKEIAILSLADACEAASRSLEKPSFEKISEMVHAIIQKRQREGQLDECDLTLRELTMIRESFIKTLTSMFHARIAYPKDDEENEDENDLFVDAERKAASTQTP